MLGRCPQPANESEASEAYSHIMFTAFTEWKVLIYTSHVRVAFIHHHSASPARLEDAHSLTHSILSRLNFRYVSTTFCGSHMSFNLAANTMIEACGRCRGGVKDSASPPC